MIQTYIHLHPLLPTPITPGSVCVCVVCVMGGLGFVVVNEITPHHQHPLFVTRGIQCRYYCSPLLHTVSLRLGWASTSVLARGVWHGIRGRSAPDRRAGGCETLPAPDFICFGRGTVCIAVTLCPIQPGFVVRYNAEAVRWSPLFWLVLQMIAQWNHKFHKRCEDFDCTF